MERTITITPRKLSGSLEVPPSKSMAHRLLICASLASGRSVVDNLSLSEDISATIGAMRALGSSIGVSKATATCDGSAIFHTEKALNIDCRESGSTIRFLIPVALAGGMTCTFTGSGRLMERPLEPYFELCGQDGITVKKENGAVTFDGKLRGGTYRLAGNISSQFITGLLFALPLVRADSRILLTTPLESAGYVDMTIQALAAFGIEIENADNAEFRIRGGQRYQPHNCAVEGDYSQAAFFFVANALGSRVALTGLREDSLQGDREILPIIKKMGTPLAGMEIDVSQIPDLVPVLAVLATQAEGVTRLTNAKRLRIKESDRLHTTTQELRKLGAEIVEHEDELIITGKTNLTGGVTCAHNDHRIAMALAIAATACSGAVTIQGAECVRKSYGNFWEDYQRLGGCIRG